MPKRECEDMAQSEFITSYFGIEYINDPTRYARLNISTYFDFDYLVSVFNSTTVFFNTYTFIYIHRRTILMGLLLFF